VQYASCLACRRTKKSTDIARDEEEEEAVADVTKEEASVIDEADLTTAAMQHFKLAVGRSCSSGSSSQSSLNFGLTAAVQ